MNKREYSSGRIVFLLDVDNTLLDNDGVQADLRRHLIGNVGRKRAKEYSGECLSYCELNRLSSQISHPESIPRKSAFLGVWWVELVVRLKFLAALVSLTLDSVDETLRAGLYVGGVSFVGVDVHGEFEARIHPHQHVAENKFAVAGDAHAHEGFVADAVTKSVLRAHVNMPQRANDSAIDLHAAGRTFERAAGRVRDVAALADGRMNAELELLGHRDLDLRVFARGPEHADALDATFRSDDRRVVPCRHTDRVAKDRRVW